MPRLGFTDQGDAADVVAGRDGRQHLVALRSDQARQAPARAHAVRLDPLQLGADLQAVAGALDLFGAGQFADRRVEQVEGFAGFDGISICRRWRLEIVLASTRSTIRRTRRRCENALVMTKPIRAMTGDRVCPVRGKAGDAVPERGQEKQHQEPGEGEAKDEKQTGHGRAGCLGCRQLRRGCAFATAACDETVLAATEPGRSRLFLGSILGSLREDRGRDGAGCGGVPGFATLGCLGRKVECGGDVGQFQATGSRIGLRRVGAGGEFSHGTDLQVGQALSLPGGDCGRPSGKRLRILVAQASTSPA